LDDPVVNGIITDVWHALPAWFPTIALDEFVVMPNHVHLIVWLRLPDDGVGATARVAPTEVGDHVEANPSPTETGAGMVAGARASLAPTEVGSDAEARPGPAETSDDIVGATLAVAPVVVALDALAPDALAPDALPPWVIPCHEKTNPNPTLGDVMGALKSLVFTVYLDWIQVHDPTRRAKFWQRNYYEHIIRNERELNAIRRYIRDNPAQWALDRDNPDNFQHLSQPTKVEDYLADIQALGEE